jgi:hypothetical protein
MIRERPVAFGENVPKVRQFRVGSIFSDQPRDLKPSRAATLAADQLEHRVGAVGKRIGTVAGHVLIVALR